jgi:hypothetical protein
MAIVAKFWFSKLWIRCHQWYEGNMGKEEDNDPAEMLNLIAENSLLSFLQLFWSYPSLTCALRALPLQQALYHLSHTLSPFLL